MLSADITHRATVAASTVSRPLDDAAQVALDVRANSSKPLGETGIKDHNREITPKPRGFRIWYAIVKRFFLDETQRDIVNCISAAASQARTKNPTKPNIDLAELSKNILKFGDPDNNGLCDLIRNNFKSIAHELGSEKLATELVLYLCKHDCNAANATPLADGGTRFEENWSLLLAKTFLKSSTKEVAAEYNSLLGKHNARPPSKEKMCESLVEELSKFSINPSLMKHVKEALPTDPDKHIEAKKHFIGQLVHTCGKQLPSSLKGYAASEVERFLKSWGPLITDPSERPELGLEKDIVDWVEGREPEGEDQWDTFAQLQGLMNALFPS